MDEKDPKFTQAKRTNAVFHGRRNVALSQECSVRAWSTGMDVGAWNVAIVTANKFEAKLQTELLRGAGARRVSIISNRQVASSEVGQLAANIIILAIDDDVAASLDWVRVAPR